MKYCVGGVCAFILSQSLFADSAVIPVTRDYDLSDIPPSATQMLKQERKELEAQSLDSIKKVVESVVAKKTKRTKNGSSIKSKSNKKSKTNVATLKTTLTSLIAQQAAISQEIVEMVQKHLQDPELQNKAVSLHVKKMPVGDVLTLISKSTGVQLVVDGDISGTVHELKFDNIPLAAALYSILSSNEPRLALLKNFGVWRVMKMQTAREIFAGQAAKEHEKDFIAQVFSVVHAKWNDALKTRIEKLWQGIIQSQTDKQNVYMVLDEVNKKVFFKARTQQANEFTHYLREIDVQVPQIRIDARVVLASKDFEENLGFKWSGVYNRRESVNHTDFIGLGPIDKNSGNAPSQTTNFNDIIGWSLNFIPTVISQSATLKIPFVFGNKDMNTKRLNLELNAAEIRNEIRTILKPSLLVCNEESAEILVGEQLPHEVRLDETIESRLTNVTTVNYKDIGMKIQVKPVVAPDHESVFLDVFVENSGVTQPSFFRGMISENQTNPNLQAKTSGFTYTIETSRSKNRVLLKSGQTTLIGGLIRHEKDDEKTGVPGLQDIPVLGWLFKGSHKKTVDKQLLIFITPTLVEI
jgi:type IV pilus assembly protein PilQ